MNAHDYVEILREVKGLESKSYDSFDELWKKLYGLKDTDETLSLEEQGCMDFLLEAMQSLGFIRWKLEAIKDKRDNHKENR